MIAAFRFASQAAAAPFEAFGRRQTLRYAAVAKRNALGRPFCGHVRSTNSQTGSLAGENDRSWMKLDELLADGGPPGRSFGPITAPGMKPNAYATN